MSEKSVLVREKKNKTKSTKKLLARSNLYVDFRTQSSPLVRHRIVVTFQNRINAKRKRKKSQQKGGGRKMNERRKLKENIHNKKKSITIMVLGTH